MVGSVKLKRATQSGFTLMELLVAIAILGIIMAIAVPGFMKVLEGQRKTTTKQTLKSVQQAIELFEMQMARVPAQLDDLLRKPEPSEYYDPAVLNNWQEGGYLKENKYPLDSWGQKLQYELTGEGAAHPYELYSYGSKDGKRTPKEKRVSVWD
jgi:general secretion pathway protein G